MLFSFYCFLFFVFAGTVTANEILSTLQASPVLLQGVIGRTLLFGSQQAGILLCRILYALYPVSQSRHGHEINDLLCSKLCP